MSGIERPKPCNKSARVASTNDNPLVLARELSVLGVNEVSDVGQCLGSIEPLKII